MPLTSTADLRHRRADAARLRALHGDRPAGGPSLVVGAVGHVGLVCACIAAFQAGAWPFGVALWPAIAWSDHAALVRLHEAVHHMLSRSRVLNELGGVAIGTLAWTPMSVYRHVHARHHAWLGRPQDPEFRPYNRPDSSRAVRVAYAWTELLFGFVVTPWLYTARTVADRRALRPAVRRRLVIEIAVIVAFWSAVAIVVEQFGWWRALVVGHLAPAWLAGVLQTLRKFGEHLGMAGDSIPAMTRTVVCRGRVGRALSWSQLHVDHHGTHHRWPRIPWFRLPEATPLAYPELRGTYRSHVAALRDALRHLADPRVGPAAQGRGVAPGTAADAPRHREGSV